MFHTIRYREHHIHLTYLGGRETIKTQIHNADGSFKLTPHKTLLGAKRAITRHGNRQPEDIGQ